MVKRWVYGTCILAAAMTLQSCKNKLETLSPYKDIPVVYGLMDQNDTTHYIRVNKVFEGNGSAYTMAQQYDSINYPAGTLSVQLQDVNNNGNVVATVTLDTTSAIQVVPGLFSYPKQLLFYTKYTLNPNDEYNLIITNEKTGKVVTGSTYLIQDVVLNGLGFSTSLGLVWSNTIDNTVSWSAVPNGAIYQMTFRFYYQEISGVDTTLKYADWVFPTSSGSDSGGYSYNYNGYAFLQFLKAYIPVTPGVIRRADTLDVIFSTGSQDFYTYLNLSQPSLTVNQDKPYFTDVKNGIGIFTARHTQITKKLLTYGDVDTIINNPTTSALNFSH